MHGDFGGERGEQWITVRTGSRPLRAWTRHPIRITPGWREGPIENSAWLRLGIKTGGDGMRAYYFQREVILVACGGRSLSDPRWVVES